MSLIKELKKHCLFHGDNLHPVYVQDLQFHLSEHTSYVHHPHRVVSALHRLSNATAV